MGEANLKTIDLETWSRRSHYEHFRNVASPHFSLCVQVNVTPLMEVMKPAGVSVHNAALYAIMRAANETLAFRTRFIDDMVVEHGVVHASTTVMLDGPDDERFGFCNIEYTKDFEKFNTNCEREISKAKTNSGLVDDVARQSNWIYLSCLPWLSFTQMTNALDGPDDCIPRIVWGKITKTHGSWFMPVSVEVHHALIDGVHVAQFYQNIEKALADVAAFLG